LQYNDVNVIIGCRAPATTSTSLASFMDCERRR
jgi:hypothetical protein